MTKILPAIFFTILIAFHSVVYAECQNQRVKVQVLGSGGPELTDGRASSSYLLWLDGKGIALIDTGSGSSVNYEKSGAKLNDLDVIAFTHFHIDHSADFPAYIKGAYFTHRNSDLKIFGPEGNDLLPSATEFVNRLFAEKGVYPYLQDYVSKQKKSPFKIIAKNLALAKHNKRIIYQSKDFSLSAIPVHHGPLPAVAWRIDVAGCAISFSGDMSNNFQTLATLAMDSDLLIAHNAIPESQQGAGRQLHMPPSEIGKIAQQAGVKQLVLSHRMTRTLGTEKQTKRLIRKYYSGPIAFANDLDTFLAVRP